MSERISVVIPVRDRTALLARALESVRGQTMAAAEVIVVDDGSEVPVAEALSPDLGDDVRVVRYEPGANAAYARNRGIETAASDYVALLDADDWWAPEHLEAAWRVIADGGYSGAFGAYWAIALGGGDWVRRPMRRPVAGERIATYLCCRPGSVRTSTLVVARELARATRFDEDLAKHQDWDFAVRAEEAGALGYNPSPTVFIDHGASGRMSGRTDVSATAYFAAKHRARFTRAERVGFLLRTARHAVEKGDGAATRAILAGLDDELTWRERARAGLLRLLALHRALPASVLVAYRTALSIRRRLGGRGAGAFVDHR